MVEGHLHEVAHCVGGAGGEDEVLRGVVLEHAPHALHVLRRVSPVADGVEVAHVQRGLQAGVDAGDGARHLAGHEGLAAARGLVVEQDSVHREHVVRLAVVAGGPVGVDLGRAVRAARPEGGVLGLRRGGRAEHLRRRRLVDLGADPGGADRLEQAHGGQTGDVAGEHRLVERDPNVRLGAEVVDLVGVDLPDQVDQRDAVVEVPVVQEQVPVAVVRVLEDGVQALGVEAGRAAHDAVHVVALLEQQLGEVRAVLPGDAGDQGRLGHGALFPCRFSAGRGEGRWWVRPTARGSGRGLRRARAARR